MTSKRNRCRWCGGGVIGLLSEHENHCVMKPPLPGTICPERKADWPAHYGSCSQISPEMRAAIDKIATDNAANTAVVIKRTNERKEHLQAITAHTVQRATGAAFDPQRIRILSRQDTIRTCAALVSLLEDMILHGGSPLEWRDRINGLTLSLNDRDENDETR